MPPPPAAADRIEPFLRAFEDAWRAGRRPAIRDHLPADLADHRPALVELALLDQELRAAGGESVPTEGYLREFPDLAADLASVVELAAAEYRLRVRNAGVRAEDYLGRFPEVRAELAARLGAADIDPGGVIGPGARLGRYVLVKEVGRGSTGTVYQARQTGVGRDVAVKVYRDVAPPPAAVARFYREVGRVGGLDHPGLVPAVEAGVARGLCYLVSEFVPGPTLAERLLSGPLPPAEAARAVLAVADALQFAHDRGVIHRDVKPANILIAPDGKPRLADFGLARGPMDSDGSSPGGLQGTPAYLPPEALVGRAESDPRWDVYSLGVVLYEALTGGRPFGGPVADILRRVLDDAPRPHDRVNPAVPAELAAVCLRCLEKRPDRRYQTAAELAADLCRFLDGERVQARSPGQGAQARRWAWRHRAWVSLAVVLAAAMLTGSVAAGWWGGRIEAARNEAARQRVRAELVLRLARLAVFDPSLQAPRLRPPDWPAREYEDCIRDASYCEEFLRLQGADPILTRDLAKIYTYAGHYANTLRRAGDAAKHFAAAAECYQTTPADHLTQTDRFNACTAAAGLAQYHLDSGRPTEAERPATVARRYAASALAAAPTDWRAVGYLAECEYLLCAAGRVERGAVDEAARPLIQSVVGPVDEKRAMAAAATGLVQRAWSGRPDLASALNNRVMQTLGTLIAEGQPSSNDLMTYAEAAARSAARHLDAGRRDDALSDYRCAAAAWDRLTADGSTDPETLSGVTATMYQLAAISGTPADRARARASLETAARVWEVTAAAHPTARVFRKRLGSAYHLRAKVSDEGAEERLAWYRRAAAVRERLFAEAGAVDDDAAEFGMTLGRVGASCLQCGLPTEAIAPLERGAEVFRDLVGRGVARGRYLRYLRQTYTDLARAYRASGRLDIAVEVEREALSANE